MIPKIIHYIWFGHSELPEKVKRNISTWQIKCPDYQIVQWNENNYDVEKIKYTAEAYKQQKYAFVSDYARLDIVNQFGGFYLDTDVELLKSLDELQQLDTVFGMQLAGEVNTGLGFGSVANAPILQENMRVYKNLSFVNKGKINATTCVEYTSRLLRGYGLQNEDKLFQLNDVTILPTEYLCPYNIESRTEKITNQTISIHHFESTWKELSTLSKFTEPRVLSLKIKLRHIVNNYFGEDAYEKIKKMIKK